MTTFRCRRILCALSVSLTVGVPPATAAIDFFWTSPSTDEPPEVTAAFAGGFDADRVTFDDLPPGLNIAGIPASVARFRVLPAQARGVTRTSAFGTLPTSVPHLLTFDTFINVVVFVFIGLMIFLYFKESSEDESE